MREPTRAEADLFCERMAQRFDATITDKDNLESDAIALVLDLAKVTDRATFLAGTATTLGTVIYIPEEFSPAKRVHVVVHEIVHVLQYAPMPDVTYGPVLDVGVRAALDAAHLVPGLKAALDRVKIDESRFRPSGFGFAWLYLTQDDERAVYEAHARATQLEFKVRAWGELPPTLDAAVGSLAHGYGLNASAVALARKILESRLQEMHLGVRRSTLVTEAIAILRSVSPELVAIDAA